MDRGAEQRGAPYWSAVQLAGWAAGNRGWVNGELLRAGHKPGLLDRLSLADTLDLLLALLVELRAKPGTTDQLAATMAVLAKPPFNLRDTWGTTPDAVAGAKAMARIAGGPAPMRQDGGARPARPARPAPSGR